MYMLNCSVISDLCNPMGRSLLAPLSMGILQARILKWVAILSSKGSSQPRDWTQVSLIAGRFFTIWANRKAQYSHSKTKPWSQVTNIFQVNIWQILSFSHYKVLPAIDLGSIPGLGRSTGEGKSYSLQYSDLENSMDYIVHGVTKCWTWLSELSLQN